MQALRTRLRLLRGPQVPREDAHWSVCLVLCTVQFRVFTGCVVLPQPHSRAFSSRPRGTPYLPPGPAPGSHRQLPICGLASSRRFPSEELGDPHLFVAGFRPSAGAKGLCVVACFPLQSRYGRARVHCVGRPHPAHPLIIFGQLSCCHCLALKVV